MGTSLTAADDGLHPAGSASNWNESRYLDFFDGALGLAGWLRLGQRVNAGYAELSICLHLPDEASYREAYHHRTGGAAVTAVVTNTDWRYVLAFNLFRLAAILRGIAARAAQGNAAGANAQAAGASAGRIAAIGLATLAGPL